MKTILIALLSCGWIMAQDFVYDINGLTDFVVVEKSDLKQAELYLKAKDWVKEVYNNPAEVLKADFENDKIRIEGVKADMVCMGGVCSSGRYQIEVSFKDGRYKFDPLSLTVMSTAGFFDVPLNDGSAYYRKNGELRSFQKNSVEGFATTFNELNNSLSGYLSGGGSDDDW